MSSPLSGFLLLQCSAETSSSFLSSPPTCLWRSSTPCNGPHPPWEPSRGVCTICETYMSPPFAGFLVFLRKLPEGATPMLLPPRGEDKCPQQGCCLPLLPPSPTLGSQKMPRGGSTAPHSARGTKAAVLMPRVYGLRQESSPSCFCLSPDSPEHQMPCRFLLGLHLSYKFPTGKLSLYLWCFSQSMCLFGEYVNE